MGRPQLLRCADVGLPVAGLRVGDRALRDRADRDEVRGAGKAVTEPEPFVSLGPCGWRAEPK